MNYLGILCKCGYTFCNKHRLPEDHECTYDHKGQAKLKDKEKIAEFTDNKNLEKI